MTLQENWKILIYTFYFSDNVLANLGVPYPHSMNDEVNLDDSMDFLENFTSNSNTNQTDEFPDAITPNSLGALQRVDVNQDLRKTLLGNLRKRHNENEHEKFSEPRETNTTIGTQFLDRLNG